MATTTTTNDVLSFVQTAKEECIDDMLDDTLDEFNDVKERLENNYLKNNCMPTRLVDAFSYRERMCDVGFKAGNRGVNVSIRCAEAEATIMFYLYSKNEIMETADLTQMIKDESGKRTRKKVLLTKVQTKTPAQAQIELLEK